MNEIKAFSRWIYVGSGEGKGIVHTVTPDPNNNEPKGVITTWSEPLHFSACRDGIAGWSWLGPVQQFLVQFKPVV